MRTAESVMIGHPDKICDQIADLILDEFLRQDKDSRVAIEVMGGHGKIFITGEVTSQGRVNYQAVFQQIQKEIGFEGDYQVTSNVAEQSPDIAQGVDTGGAGDQGIMVGYATSETPEMLPLPFALARRITSKLDEVGESLGLGPDGKAQVTTDNDKVLKVVVSVQHREELELDEIRKLVKGKILKEVLGKIDGLELFINATGRFVLGGFGADSGLTGRKVVIDAYGPEINVGGGSFSGKDPSKVDRSGAYMARYLARWLLKKFALPEAKVSLAYSIGVAEPLMVKVEPDGEYTKLICKEFDLTPQGIIKFLDLKKPIYLQTARLGHFGNPDLPWEKA